MKKIKNYLDITEEECIDIVRSAWKKIKGKTPNRKNVSVLELGTELIKDTNENWTLCKIYGCKIYCAVYGKKYDITCSVSDFMNQTLVTSPKIYAESI